MPRKQGIGRKYKKSRLTVTEEPTPEVEEQPEEDVEEEEPELDDEVIEVIEEATSTVMDTVIEKLIDVDFMVGSQVFRLHSSERSWRPPSERRWRRSLATGRAGTTERAKCGFVRGVKRSRSWTRFKMSWA